MIWNFNRNRLQLALFESNKLLLLKSSLPLIGLKVFVLGFDKPFGDRFQALAMGTRVFQKITTDFIIVTPSHRSAHCHKLGLRGGFRNLSSHRGSLNDPLAALWHTCGIYPNIMVIVLEMNEWLSSKKHLKKHQTHN